MSATMACDAPQKLAKAASRATELLRRGGLVVFPTETVYGVAASVKSERGLDRLRRLKQRSADKPFSVHMPSVQSAAWYVNLEDQPLLDRLIRKTMPGPITIIAQVADEVIADRLAALGLPLDAGRLLYWDNTIGLRCPDHPVAAEFLGGMADPIVASSANYNGQPETHTAQAAADALGKDVDLVLDGGRSRYEKPSTVVRVADGRLDVLRAGVYDERYLTKLTQQNVLFVCSGNTCRSPMAEAIARHEIAKRRKVAEGWSAQSAGAFAASGSPATPEAVSAVRRMGIKPPDHRSQSLTIEMIQHAQVIYCMTQMHQQAVLAMVPDAADRVKLLDPDGDIEDPIGAGEWVYDECARHIAKCIDRAFEALGL